ncbi:MFS transporter [Alteromonas oceanisediminis]|uniref:MFS transporter n=1 Tax=Alteromonas oceanisediminis TaxID=2836180 RepID=UPI001BDB4DD6|nr:MFS transporter [Alteromonas oceanisediminis]MBT0587586.1 MFS transporter [Alteromonas oceanisediminis]
MSRYLIIFAIAACYFVFAILLNSVGTVILQSINSFDITKTDAGLLEGFKDLSIAIVSFLVASFVPRIGYRFALAGALLLVTVVCFITPGIAEFWAFKLQFAAIGSAFAFVKISVYSVIGQLSPTVKSHSSLMNFIEGLFMVGVLSGYWVFSAFIDPLQPTSLGWLAVYYWLAGLLLVTTLIVLAAPIAKPPQQLPKPVVREFVDMLQLTYQPLELIFVISIFMYVLIEQGIGTWLPTFNSQVLFLPADVSVQLTSLFAAMIALGRLSAGVILRVVDWFTFLVVCLIGIGAVLLISLSMTNNVPNEQVTTLMQAPLAAFLMPVVGLMMAPIYPVLNSIILSALTVSKQPQMTGLIVVFSALGGTTGSLITGKLFDTFGGQHAFYLILIPITLLLICLVLFRRANHRVAQHAAAQEHGVK